MNKLEQLGLTDHLVSEIKKENNKGTGLIKDWTMFFMTLWTFLIGLTLNWLTKYVTQRAVYIKLTLGVLKWVLQKITNTQRKR